MAASHRLVLIVAAAALMGVTAGIPVGHYALPSRATGPSSSSGSFADYAQQAEASEAATNVRAAVPAMEAWNADHGGYEGATLDRLRSTYDPTLHGVNVVFSTRTDYCLESRVGDEVASKHGPGGDILPQPCG